MSTPSRSLALPNFFGVWCNQDGSLTPLALSTMHILWQRTGNAPGIDAQFLEQTADTALLKAHIATAEAIQARHDALTALEKTTELLQTVLSMRATTQKALEKIEELTIINSTDRRIS